MTYSGFHGRFNLPLTLGLGLASGLSHRAVGSGEIGAALAVFVLVFLFAAPWDNWAVQRGIWGFDPHRTGARIGWLPWEEYLFFLWQSFHVVATVWLLFRFFPGLRTGAETPVAPITGFLVLGVAAGTASVVHRWREKPRSPRWGYAWHLLAWFLPLISVQWAVAPGLLFRLLPVVGGAALFWGTYYTVVDCFAVRSGIWFFDPKQIQGSRLFGILPWEEAVFFYLTSLLVAQSFVLLLPAACR